MSLLTTLSRPLLALALATHSLAALAADPAKIRVGVRSGPGEQIAEVAAKVAARDGLQLVPVVIDGLVNPNDALHNGDIEANAFQHLPFLTAENKNKKYTLVATVPTASAPLAIYSVKHRKVDEIPSGGTIAIPQDDANRSRALLALQDHGLLTLRDGVDEAKAPITLLEVAQNPRKLKFVELAVTVLPRTLADVDAGAVSATHAYRIAKLPLDQAIAVENPERTANYNTRVVFRAGDETKPWAKKLEAAYTSPEVRDFIVKEFGTTLVPAF